jgi:phosphatidylglycerol---prolipoprotein diacylglyceryl transferase
VRSWIVDWLAQFLPAGVASAIAPGWFSCVGLAGLVGLLVMLALARRRPAPTVDGGIVASAVLWCYVAAVGAGIVVPMAIDAIEQLVFHHQLQLRWSGMTSFWGYLAGFGAVALVCRRHAIPLARFGDLAAVPMGVALVFARIGCFLGGCDYGKVTSVPWAVRFPSGSPAWRDHVKAGLLPPDRLASLPVHPTQLYEAGVGLAIIGIALVIARSRWARAREGRVFLLAAATYAVGRIAVEAVRGDLGRGIYAGLSSGQIFSIGVLVAIGAGTVLHRRRVLAIATTGAVALVALVALVAPHAAEAWPMPAQPTPTPEPQPQPAPAAPQPAPAAVAAPGMAQPTDPYAPPARPPVLRQGHRRALDLELGLFGALAMPIDRRADQVSALGGVSLSAGLLRNTIGAWIDLDSLGNRDASHGTILLSGGALVPLGNGKLALGGRVGAGATLVNFDQPAFRDVAGAAFRIEALAEYAITDRWCLQLRPLSFDILSAADLGGPITTWQIRAGVAYRFHLRTAR